MAKDDIAPYVQVHSQASLVYDMKGFWWLTVLHPSLIIFGEQPNIEDMALEESLLWNSLTAVKSGTLQFILHGWLFTAGKHGSIS